MNDCQQKLLPAQVQRRHEAGWLEVLLSIGLLFVLFTAWLALPRLGLAQNTSGEIAGTVRDASGAVLPGVSITISSPATGMERKLVTDSAGNYAAAQLPVGEYNIRAELSNFKTQLRERAALRVAERLRIDIGLELGEISEEVTVTESAPLLRTTNAEVSEVISNEKLEELPLSGRQFVDMTLLTDNIVPEPRGTRGAALSQTGRSIAVAGQRGGHNMYFLDGVSITDQYFNNIAVSPSVDSIQEFNIQKSIYAAEFGGKAAATISAATKAGTNNLHGGVYEFLRNSALDARNFFDPASPPPLRQNQFGGILGGPVQPDRTFFFLGYESLQERRSLTRTFSVPSERVRRGDFSGLPAIYDPLSTLANGRRILFTGNQIPAERMDPVALEFLKKIPLPTGSGEVQNFVSSPTFENSHHQFSVRADRHFGSSDSVFARFTFANLITFQPYGSTNLNETLLPGFGYDVTTYTRNLAINHTHIFSPSLVHEFRFGYLRVAGGQESENQGSDFARRAGLRGVTSDPRRAGFPALSFADAYSTMGDPANLVSRKNNSFDFFSNLSWVKGAHHAKFGVYVFRLRFNPLEAPNSRGVFNFTPRFTSSAAGLSDGNAFADFLLGYPSTAQGGLGRGEEDSRTTWIHMYAQDDWQPRSGLTINAGLRYEINGHMSEVQNRLSSVELERFVIASDEEGRIHPDANALLPLIPIPYTTSAEAGYHRSLLRPSYLRIAPRLGIAWSPGGDSKTVVRTGIGLYYNQWAYSVQTLLAQNLPFYSSRSVTTASDTLIPTLTTSSILETTQSGSIGAGTMEPGYRTEYATSWTLDLQRELSGGMVAQANYFGSKVIGADDTSFQNIPLPGPGNIDARRPNPLLNAIRTIHWGGWSIYHSMSLGLDKRMAGGLSASAKYTWSKSMDVASNPGPTFSETNFPQDVYNRRNEKALSSFDVRHRLVVSGSYRLPVWLGGDGWREKLAEGWTLTTIASLQSGAPFTVNIPSDNANIGAGPAQRPDLPRDPVLHSGQTPERWFDTSAFALAAPFTFGNLGRNTLFSDGLHNIDFSILKSIPITETASAEFRFEIFNLLNHTNFSNAPGRIAFTPSFGRYFQAENPRQLQLGLKLSF